MNRARLLYFILPVVVAVTFFLGFLGVRSLLVKEGNDEEHELYDGETVRLIVGARLVSLRNPPVVRDNEIALDLAAVRRYIDGTVDWDEDNQKVTVTTRDRIVRMNTDSLTAFVNDSEEVRLDLPVFIEDGTVYLPLKFLSDFFQIRVTYVEENNLVIVDDRKAIVQAAAVVEDGAVIRLGRSIDDPVVWRYSSQERLPSTERSPTPDTGSADSDGGEDGNADSGDAGGDESSDAVGDITDFDEGAVDMYVFEDYEGWYKVRTPDGIIGYIEKKYVAVRRYVDKVALAPDGASAWKPADGKISMVWEQVASARGNPNTADIPDMPGLDVVSPTWFILTDGGGTVESKASAEYIDWARGRGYKVWALFANTMNDIDMTSEFLNDSLARENAIRSLLAYAVMLGIDGVNLDFENVYLSDRDALTQFVRELAPMLRDQGLVFSVDVNVPDGSDTWSKCYDTPAIAAAADYVNLMAYDQYGARSPAAGSVSQLSWVELNLDKLINRDGVPAGKIILGIPFYTRVWEMESAEEPKGGSPSDSSALGMNTAIGNVLDNGGDVEWDGESGQFFCTYAKEGNTYQVWLEDPQSVNMRSSLAHKYALAGVSAWSRNFVIPEIWDVLYRNLKDIKTYSEWQAEAYVEEPRLAHVSA